MRIKSAATTLLVMFVFLSLLYTPLAFAVDPDMQPLVIDNGSGISPVPEPSTIILLGIGLLGLAGVSRRKK